MGKRIRLWRAEEEMAGLGRVIEWGGYDAELSRDGARHVARELRYHFNWLRATLIKTGVIRRESCPDVPEFPKRFDRAKLPTRPPMAPCPPLEALDTRAAPSAKRKTRRKGPARAKASS